MYLIRSDFERQMLPYTKIVLWASVDLNVHNHVSWDIMRLGSPKPLFPGNNISLPIVINPSDSSISKYLIQPLTLALACFNML